MKKFAQYNASVYNAFTHPPYSAALNGDAALPEQAFSENACDIPFSSADCANRSAPPASGLSDGEAAFSDFSPAETAATAPDSGAGESKPAFSARPNDRDRFIYESLYGFPKKESRGRKPNDREAFIAECLNTANDNEAALRKKETQPDFSDASAANAEDDDKKTQSINAARTEFQAPSAAQGKDADKTGQPVNAYAESSARSAEKRKDEPDYAYLEPPSYYKKTEPKQENSASSKYYSYILKHNAALKNVSRRPK